MKQGIVYYRDIPAGTLTKDENGFCFHYFDDYYTNSQMPAISVTFPKTQQEYRSPHLFSFFFGLLAEGAQKERQCRELRIDENDLNGNHAAEAIGFPPESVFKTLVTRGPKTGINVFCIPVCCELDLKKAAKAAGDKSIEMIKVSELLGLTGYIRGGCSPVGMKKKYRTFIDETCLLSDQIAVSAGERGHQMILPPQALADLVAAELVDIIA